MKETTEEAEVKEQENTKQFSGNYIESFERIRENEKFPGKFDHWENREGIVLVHGENLTLEVRIVTDDIFRFRYGINGYLEDDFSYALDPEYVFHAPEYRTDELSREIRITTGNLILHINKLNLKTRITDRSNQMIVEDEKGFHWEEEQNFGGNIVICTKKKHDGESYFGLGDKTGGLNLNESRRELWGTDCYGYGNETDPVYKNIPFFLGLNKKQGYGIFMDNTFRSFFDFGKERKNACSFWAQGGEMKYYFIYGPKLQDVAVKYTWLTGTPEMPPKWALGYQQSKWSYYPESVVRNLAKEFRDRKIPCDVIHLDIDYMDGFRCFTWDKEKFPDPPKMIADLKKKGFKTVVINDPGIKIDKNYFAYQQGVENGYFCTRADGPLLKGSVWPGLCHFPDFTKPATREWWAGLYEGLIGAGVDGVWNDMNEPAVFEGGTFPFDARHDFDGHSCSHRKAHNVYGMQMSRASMEGQKRFLGDKRPLNISRSAYAGIQRYASVWTGDNLATWDHLKIANVQCQRLSESGVSFVGSDVGGFIGTPSAELYTRWIQMAVFHPFFRTHSSGDHGDKEPWVFDDHHLDIVRKFIEFRYQLLPYIYTTFWQYSELGIPMIRSLHLNYQDDFETHYRQHEFEFGDNLLVCPVVTEKCASRKLYLPKGTWFNFWTDKKSGGKKEVEVATPLNQIPIFVKAGVVLPMQPVMQYVDEFEFENLGLHVYAPNETYESIIYEDAGDGYGYKNGEKCIRKFITSKTDEGYLIRQEINGDFQSNYVNYDVVCHGMHEPEMIMADEHEVKWEWDKSIKQIRIMVQKNVKEIRIN